MNTQKIIIAVTGASGSIYAKRLLDILKALPHYTVGVVLSDNSKQVAKIELGEDFMLSKTHYPSFSFYKANDFMAPFASGSANYNTMIVLPCSMGKLSKIAQGSSDDLITRSADVILKEGRTLVLGLRDTPYNLIHIENMKRVVLSGGIICPATPSFYSLPQTINELVDTVVHRICNLANIPVDSFSWGEK